MLEDITSKYTKKDNNWFCNTCSGEIYSGKKKYSSSCICINKIIQHKTYIKYLENYYEINESKYYCKKCNSNITSKRELHALSCIGLGSKRNRNSQELISDNFLDTCNLGCGKPSKFFYKSGKAYCCKLGNSCPIKVEKDRSKKIGVNPFEGRVHPKGMLGKTNYNKGLTKETSELIARNSMATKARLALSGGPMKGKTHSQETRDKIAKIARDNNYGGYKKGSGRGKQGWYKGFHCDSSWELAYVIYCLEHNISIKRSTERRTYIFQGKTRGYYPDFIVNNDLVEIKGYNSDEWEAKHAANPDVKTLYKEEMKPILKYAMDKYGKDFIKLYETKIT
jgi:hypothetical protein